MKKPLKIKLNEEQTRKFLSFFIKEAIEIVKKRNQQSKQINSQQIENNCCN